MFVSYLKPFFLAILSFWFLACPMATETQTLSEASISELLADLQGSWSGDLSCYEEGVSSSGVATLTLVAGDQMASGSITLDGTLPSPFVTTANLEITTSSDGSLTGKWSNCVIEGGVMENDGEQLTCHFWHQIQDGYYAITPNQWALNDGRNVLSMLEHLQVESEAQKCHGELAKSQ